jgi:hypothetical protein
VASTVIEAALIIQPRFGHHMGRRKASHANHAAQVGKKTEIFFLSDKLLGSASGIRLSRPTSG